MYADLAGTFSAQEITNGNIFQFSLGSGGWSSDTSVPLSGPNDGAHCLPSNLLPLERLAETEIAGQEYSMNSPHLV
jgi:hypothetical protein